MAWRGESKKTGKPITLLNPYEKGNKYFNELQVNTRFTNDGVNKNGGQPLTPEQRAYRAGYLAAQKDSHKAFKAKHPRYKSKVEKV